MKLITLTPTFCEIVGYNDENLAVAYRSPIRGHGWFIVNLTTGKTLAFAARKKFLMIAFELYLTNSIEKIDMGAVLN